MVHALAFGFASEHACDIRKREQSKQENEIICICKLDSIPNYWLCLSTVRAIGPPNAFGTFSIPAAFFLRFLCSYPKALW